MVISAHILLLCLLFLRKILKEALILLITLVGSLVINVGRMITGLFGALNVIKEDTVKDASQLGGIFFQW